MTIFTACPWLVLVPSQNPEPDSAADLHTEVDCGAPVTNITTPAGEVYGWACENGHHHYDYGSAAQQAEERDEALVEMAAQTDTATAYRLDEGF